MKEDREVTGSIPVGDSDFSLSYARVMLNISYFTIFGYVYCWSLLVMSVDDNFVLILQSEFFNVWNCYPSMSLQAFAS